jgi:hypothetical protein
MKSATNPYEKMLAEGRTSLRPEEIKAYGVKRFLDEQAERGPFPIPDFYFTEEENRLMDQILAEKRLPTNESEVRED